MNGPSIDGIRLETPFLLGPMAGITDAPYRRVARRMGASLCCTEMVSSKGLYYNDKKTEKLLFMYEDEGPSAVQIFGHEPDIMAFAADKLKERRNVILDINMGCPVPKVFKNGDGSALSKDPELAYKVMKAAVDTAGKPVTAKIRLGVDSDHINVLEMAKALEEGGASAIAVHARTREQFYSGEADWSMIKDVKEASGIPIIGNGDVKAPADAFRMMRETGCDFVMIARASLGDPWIFRDLKEIWDEHAGAPAEERAETDEYAFGDAEHGGAVSGARPDARELLEMEREAGDLWKERSISLEDRKEMLLKELSDMTELKGEYAAVREMRKVVGWYVKGLPGSAAIRREVNSVTEKDRMTELIESI